MKLTVRVFSGSYRAGVVRREPLERLVYGLQVMKKYLSVPKVSRCRLAVPALLAAVLGIVHGPAWGANGVSVATVSATPGQTGVTVNVFASTAVPATLLSLDITFNQALCERVQNQTILKAGRTLAVPQEGGIRCPGEGKVSIVLLDPELDGDPVVPPCTCMGDANKNGFVNGADFGSVQTNFGAAANANTGAGDANCNNFVNGADFGSVQSNFGAPCASGAGAGGPVAQWKFDVLGGAAPGAFPLTVTVNEASNGPLKICANGTVVGTDPCPTPIGTTNGSFTIMP